MNLEAKVLVELVKKFQPEHAVTIYNSFIQDYKDKHIGEHLRSAEWYDKRANTFARYVSMRYKVKVND